MFEIVTFETSNKGGYRLTLKAIATDAGTTKTVYSFHNGTEQMLPKIKTATYTFNEDGGAWTASLQQTATETIITFSAYDVTANQQYIVTF